MSYDPAARIHTRGERIADDEAAWPIDVRTYDEILMATYLEGLSAETRAFLENAGMHSLQLQIAHKPKATILDLKKVLARHYKLPVESLTLLRGGQSLADAVNVQGLGMERIGPLSLVIRR